MSWCVDRFQFPAYCSLVGYGLGFSDPVCFLTHIASLRVILFGVFLGVCFEVGFFFRHICFSELYLSVHFYCAGSSW